MPPGDFTWRVITGDVANFVPSQESRTLLKAGATAIAPSGGGADAPTTFRLLQNSPNPFNPSTVIRYGFPRETRVRLEVFSILGEKVATLVDGVMPRGMHEAEFRADGLPSGTYFYVLNAGGKTLSGKMLLAR